MQMNHSDKAAALFSQRFHCSQAVLAAFAEELGLSEEQALRLGGSFGGGMCKGEVCGACTGALMAIGLKYGQGDTVDPDKKNAMLAKSAAFGAKFAEKYGSCLCKEVLGYKIPEEMEQIMAENKFDNVCCHLVTDACQICAEILNED